MPGGVLSPLFVLAPLGLLLLRIIVGVAFVFHGYPKIIGPGRQQTQGWLKSMGFPAVLGPLAGLLEFVGGIFLWIGFLTPIVGILLVTEMIGTTILSKTKLGKKYVLGYELDLAYLGAALLSAMVGAGPISLDAILGIT